MKEIELTQGYTAIVDEIDADLSSWSWQAMSRNGKFYAVHSTRSNGKIVPVNMHRVILARMLGRELEKHELPDHINRNPLDNRRGNLRIATRSQNGANTKLNANNTSGYKGVSFHKGNGKWQAQIKVNQHKKALGYFNTPEEASDAYREAALEHFGEFATP